MNGDCGGAAANFNVQWEIKSSMTWSAKPHGERWRNIRTKIFLPDRILNDNLTKMQARVPNLWTRKCLSFSPMSNYNKIMP